MIPPPRKTRGNTQQTLADEQAKAAADETAKAAEKTAAKWKRKFDQCDSKSTIAEEDAASDTNLFASVLEGRTSFAPLTELKAPDNGGTLPHSEWGKNMMESASYARQKVVEMKNKKKRIEDENGGKSLEVVIKEHHGNDIDLCVPALVGAGDEMGWREMLRDGSYNTKESKKSKDFLHGDSDNALGQQNGFDLTQNQVQTINYRAVIRGHSATNAGYMIGSMGTTVNPQGKTVDAAASKAQKANYADNPDSGLSKHNQKLASNWQSRIPRYALEHCERLQCLIDANNNLIDLSNMSHKAVTKVLKKVEGVQFDSQRKYDAFIESVWSDRAKEANKKPTEKGRREAWRQLRTTMNNSLCQENSKMRFERERYDKEGVLPKKIGPSDKRLQKAGFRFKIKDKKQRFEL